MLTKRLTKIMRRQSVLVGKIMDGTVTDEEKAELEKITKTVEAATGETAIEIGKTSLTTMKLSEFKDHIEALEAEMGEELNPQQVALMRKNIQAVKNQGKTDPEDIVAVEILEDTSSSEASERIKALEQVVADLTAKVEAGFDGRTQTGVVDGKPGEESSQEEGDSESTEKSVAQTLASEGLEALIARFEKVKEKVAGGTLTKEDLEALWENQWDIKSMLDGSMAIMIKIANAKELIEGIVPELKKLSEKNENEETEPEGEEEEESETEKQLPSNCPECNSPLFGKEKCPNCEWVYEAEASEQAAEKSSGSWWAGQDLSDNTDGGTSDYKALKAK